VAMEYIWVMDKNQLEAKLLEYCVVRGIRGM
jgi:hypothetical protein